MLRTEEYICNSTGQILAGEEIVKGIISKETEDKQRQTKGLRIRKSKEGVQILLDCRYGEVGFSSYKKVIEVFTSNNIFDGDTALSSCI